MTPSMLSALIRLADLPSWLAVAVLVVVVLWFGVKFSDRWALAANHLMLARDRRAARKAALAATSEEEFQRAMAVLDKLGGDTTVLTASAPPSPHEKRSTDA